MITTVDNVANDEIGGDDGKIGKDVGNDGPDAGFQGFFIVDIDMAIPRNHTEKVRAFIIGKTCDIFGIDSGLCGIFFVVIGTGFVCSLAFLDLLLNLFCVVSVFFVGLLFGFFRYSFFSFLLFAGFSVVLEVAIGGFCPVRRSGNGGTGNSKEYRKNSQQYGKRHQELLNHIFILA